jgi:alanine-glyoxylate transaminase/serine-glyoxylate transaminase/serine-pyruvate transaminase
MSFTGVSEKAMAAHATATLRRFYFDWTLMNARSQKSFIGTVPVNIFFGLRESIRLLDEEGLDNVVARHARLAEATRLAVRVWAGNDGPALFCLSPDRYSNSVTAILMPEGFSADTLRKTVRERFNVSLGGGLGPLGGKVFRIGHLGDLNEPMLLGALASVEMGLRIEGVPHGRGGVEAAMAYLAGA